MLPADNSPSPSVAELVDVLMVKLYEPPLCEIRAALDDLPEPLRVLMLVADFDTEVSMNGLVGFIENSTGARLPETIAAFETISAHITAGTLRQVERVMHAHGVTHPMLRELMGELQPYSIASFSVVHGPRATAMAKELTSLETRLYLSHSGSAEPVFKLLYSYLEPHGAELLSATGLS